MLANLARALSQGQKGQQSSTAFDFNGLLGVCAPSLLSTFGSHLGAKVPSSIPSIHSLHADGVFPWMVFLPTRLLMKAPTHPPPPDDVSRALLRPASTRLVQ